MSADEPPDLGPPADAAQAKAPAAALPDTAPSTAEELPPPRLSYQRRYNLAIVGGALLAATWGADRLLTQDLPAPTSWVPWIPLVGPWYLLDAQTHLAAPSGLTMAVLAFDGLLQAGGLTMGILGFVLHKKRMVVSLPPKTR